MNAPSMPEVWIERLFSRFSAIYGNRMTAMWGDCPKADLMDAWMEGLNGIDPERIRYALGGVMSAHPEWPPTLGEFLLLCKPPLVPAAHRLYLPAPRGEMDPKVKEQVDKLLQRNRKRHPKDWAREIMARHECGENLLPIQLQFAREALGLDAERAAIQSEAA